MNPKTTPDTHPIFSCKLPCLLEWKINTVLLRAVMVGKAAQTSGMDFYAMLDRSIRKNLLADF